MFKCKYKHFMDFKNILSAYMVIYVYWQQAFWKHVYSTISVSLLRKTITFYTFHLIIHLFLNELMGSIINENKDEWRGMKE